MSGLLLVQVTPLQQCEASSLNNDCFNCDVVWLASGSCMPGVYAYQYTLTNPDGYSAVPVNVTVQIYEQVSPGTSHILSLDCVLCFHCVMHLVLSVLILDGCYGLWLGGVVML